MSLTDINKMFGYYHLNFLRATSYYNFIFHLDDNSIGLEVYFTVAPGDILSEGMLFENIIRLYTVTKVIMLNSRKRRHTIFDRKETHVDKD